MRGGRAGRAGWRVTCAVVVGAAPIGGFGAQPPAARLPRGYTANAGSHRYGGVPQCFRFTRAVRGVSVTRHASSRQCRRPPRRGPRPPHPVSCAFCVAWRHLYVAQHTQMTLTHTNPWVQGVRAGRAGWRVTCAVVGAARMRGRQVPCARATAHSTVGPSACTLPASPPRAPPRPPRILFFPLSVWLGVSCMWQSAHR